MTIISRGARGLAAVLVGAGALAAAGCGEVPGTPENTPSQARASALVTERERVIQDRAVLDDAVRTGWSGTLSTDSGAADGAWNFGRLMARMSGPVASEDFLRGWLESPSVNGRDSATRPLIDQVISAWPKHADGTLDLTKSPMRLQAIVNHPDARDASRGTAGEGHLLFDVLDASGSPLPLTVTLKYDLPARTQADVLDWAHRWHALATWTPGTDAFNTALQAITDRFTAGTARAEVRALDSETAGARESRRLGGGPGSTLLDDVQPPTAALTSPAAGSFLRATVAVSADAIDDVGVARVDFFNGSTLIGSATQAPYTVSWNTTGNHGTRTLTAQAFDAAGNSGTSSPVSVFVDNYAPVVMVDVPRYNPYNQNYVRGFINVGWLVTDQSSSGVAQVQLLQDGVVVATVPGKGDTTYYFPWDTRVLANRAYAVGVRATDNVGNVQTSNRTLIVDNAPPSSALTAPANGAQVSGVVTLAANASDTQALMYVAFEIDGVIQTPYSTTAPFTRTWDTTGKSGTHVIVAIASDRAGNTRRSNAVTVTVP